MACYQDESCTTLYPPSYPGVGLPVLCRCSSIGLPSPTACAVMAQPVSVKETVELKLKFSHVAICIHPPFFLTTKNNRADLKIIMFFNSALDFVCIIDTICHLVLLYLYIQLI